MNREDKPKFIKTGSKAAEKPTQEELIEIAELCEGMYKDWPQCYKFVNQNKQYPAVIMIKALKGIKEKGRYNEIWGYAQVIMENESMKYYNQKFLSEYENNKIGVQSAREILRGILK